METEPRSQRCVLGISLNGLIIYTQLALNPADPFLSHTMGDWTRFSYCSIVYIVRITRIHILCVYVCYIGQFLTCDAGAVLLWVKILLGRLWLCWIHWRLRSSLCARWYKHRGWTYQSHWCARARAHNQRAALIIKRGDHLFHSIQNGNGFVCLIFQFLHCDSTISRIKIQIGTNAICAQLYNFGYGHWWYFLQILFTEFAILQSHVRVKSSRVNCYCYELQWGVLKMQLPWVFWRVWNSRSVAERYCASGHVRSGTELFRKSHHFADDS